MHQTFRFALRAAAAVSVMAGFAGFASPAAACNTEPYLATICTFTMDWCPRGYLPADGRTLAIREYTALFGLIGFSYGGDGQNLFAIPDLRGRVPVGKGLGAGLTNSIAMTQKFGQQELTLSTAQVPLVPHSHTATFAGTGGGGTGPLAASGPASLAVSGTTSGLTTSASANLPVTGSIKIGSSAPGTKAAALTSNANLSSSGFGSANIYGTGGTGNDVVLGPANGGIANGAATGTVTGTVSGTVGGTATGTVTLPVTGATGITGGTVTVNPTGQAAAQPVPTYPPSIGMSVCIAVQGLYPNRP